MKSLKTPLRILVGAVTGTLLLGGLWQLVYDKLPGFLWASIFFLVSAAFEAIRPHRWRILRTLRRRFCRTYGLRGKDRIDLEIAILIQKAERIHFCGRLCQKLAEAIRDRWASTSPKKPSEVRVWHTNPDFWSTDRELASQLLRLDAVWEEFRLKFALYDQLVDTLIVSYDDHWTLLARWKCQGGTEYAVVVRKWPGPDLAEFSESIAFACGIIPDGAEHADLEVARKSLAESCRAVRAWRNGDFDGCAFPVVPCLADEDVNNHMITRNLQWFDEAARTLIHGASVNDTVAVTWRLHESSMQEGELFEKWLYALESGTIRVKRYLVIDKKIATSPGYEEVVSKIVEKYFPSGSTNRRVGSDTYTVRYVGKWILDHYNIPDQDLSLFEIGGGKWAQGSVYSSSPRKTVRLWFAKSKNIVKDFEDYFKVLDDSRKTHSNLDELIGAARDLV